MKIKIILIAMLTLPLLMGVSCKKQEKESLATKFEKEFGSLQCIPDPVFGKKNEIIGKWKLVQKCSAVGEQNGGLIFDTVDVSCNNVIYEFKSDNTLTITGDKDDITPGNYTYIYQPVNDWYINDFPPNLQIVGLKNISCFIYEYKIVMPNVNKAFIRIK